MADVDKRILEYIIWPFAYLCWYFCPLFKISNMILIEETPFWTFQLYLTE